MKDARFAKSLVFINSLVPLALLGWDAYWQQLGANPINFALHTTGMLALIFLMLTLCVTPLRKITGKNFFSHFRRMLGLFTFFYGCIHLSIYFTFDQSLDISNVLHDLANRPFIFFGMAALFLMIPLAMTSTNQMIRRLGAAKWKRLHQLIYISAIAGVVHFWLFVKADTRLPLGFALVLALLLGYRLKLGIFKNRPPKLRPVTAVG